MILQGGNPDLDPETATSWTLGFDVRPTRWPGLSFSVTGFDIAFRNRIDRPVAQNAAGVFTDPTLAPFVRRISPATQSADLTYIQSLIDSPAFNPALGVFPATDYVAVIDNRYVNTTTLHVRGLDVQAGYTFHLGDDPVTLGGNATWMADYKQRTTPTSAVVERVGLVGFPVKLRGRATLDWTHDPFTFGVALNYIDGYHDPLGAKIDSQATVDLQLRWVGPSQGWAKDWEVLVGVRNVFDTDPPFYDNPAGVGYDPTNADPIGRFASIQLTRRW
jgi:outer membrane receptor protein involved in Fe transport